MSLPTNYTDDWWLEKDSPRTSLEEVRDAATGAITGYREVNHFTIILVRYVLRVTALVTERGMTRSSFSVKTGPDTGITVSYIGKKFYCTEHTRGIVKAETGLYEERQIWVHRSIGELIPVNGLKD